MLSRRLKNEKISPTATRNTS